ncbi:hypothetical protein [Saccharothrix carnea]|uniref:hypothetical protein n=1 Tax=Saccharothrix carnea TaxID=1280637 RepID=UPI0015E6B129|nr:hypothetical protein [Saccharothrix carnea]
MADQQQPGQPVGAEDVAEEQQQRVAEPERQQPPAYPELAEALYRDVFDPRGGTFTSTVLRHYAANGRVDPRRLTPITTQIGEAMVFKLLIDLGRAPTPDEPAAIVDEVILPAVGFPLP